MAEGKAARAARLDLATLRAIPRGVWGVGLVSLFMDMSSEMIHALLPVYLVTVLGASALSVGLIEGVAEATASIVKVFSGALSDWFGRRKALAVIGYGLAALSKPVFPLAGNVLWIFLARFADRIGKGIRGAPRDALMADITPRYLIGAAYGLRQALDTLGAVLGPLIAMALMWLTAANFTFVFWAAVVPALAAVVLLVVLVREPARPGGTGPVRFPLHTAAIRRLGKSYWLICAAATLFSLARFSEAFVILRAQQLGLSLALVPLVLIVMNLAFSAAAYPAGVISDRLGRPGVLALGIALLVGADLVLAFAGSLGGIAAGIVLWGLHLAFTQGLLSALVADTAPADLRGTAFGVFNMVTGLALLAASMIAGALWDFAGAEAVFLFGAGIAALAFIAFGALRAHHRICRGG
ncbi:MAG TPA: MFS transporter [Hyphomicrobiales bacterium]|nr:MFS transporter [Rhodobiaceae bacterium]HXK53058.1 MFS transporter [Hyphomicrobiales bacterium]